MSHFALVWKEITNFHFFLDHDKNEVSDVTPNPDSQRLNQEVAEDSSVPSQSLKVARLENDESNAVFISCLFFYPTYYYIHNFSRW